MPKRVYINEQVFESLASVSDLKEDSLNRAVSGFLYMRTVTLRSLKGRFLKAELVSLVDCFSGTFIDVSTPVPPKLMLQYEMEDHHQLNDAPVLHGYDGPALLEKLSALSDIEAYFLLDEIRRFWNVPQAYGAPQPDLEKFLAGLLG